MKLSKLRASTSARTLAGTTIPRQDTTSFGMRNALKRAAGGRCMGDVDGKPMRSSLAKPGRKRGGAVCKADGGEIGAELSKDRISEDSKRTAARLRDSSDAAGRVGVGMGSIGLGTVLGAGRGLARRLGAAAIPAGVGIGALGTKELSEAKRIERGEAEPGKEDRKFGGRAKRKAKDNDGDE